MKALSAMTVRETVANVAGDVRPGSVLFWVSRYFIISMNVSPCYYAVPAKGIIVATVNPGVGATPK